MHIDTFNTHTHLHLHTDKDMILAHLHAHAHTHTHTHTRTHTRTHARAAPMHMHAHTVCALRIGPLLRRPNMTAMTLEKLLDYTESDIAKEPHFEVCVCVCASLACVLAHLLFDQALVHSTSVGIWHLGCFVCCIASVG